MISKEFQIKVFEIMTWLISAKGSRKKMVSVFDINDGFKAKGYAMSKVLIEACLDVLINHKYVRYYRNEKGYIYYGITELGWTRWQMYVGSTGMPAVINQITIDEIILQQAEQHVANESVTTVVTKKRGRPRKTA